MNLAATIAVAAPGTIGMVVFGVLWLSTLRQLHKAETERDRYWDMCPTQAGLLIAHAVISEQDRSGG